MVETKLFNHFGGTIKNKKFTFGFIGNDTELDLDVMLFQSNGVAVVNEVDVVQGGSDNKNLSMYWKIRLEISEDGWNLLREFTNIMPVSLVLLSLNDRCRAVRFGGKFYTEYPLLELPCLYDGMPIRNKFGSILSHRIDAAELRIPQKITQSKTFNIRLKLK